MRPVIRDFFIEFGNIFRKPRTVVYPKEKIIIPDGSRGIPRLKLDLDSLEMLCNYGGICHGPEPLHFLRQLCGDM
jgi:formate hydrogenlyase subunit 6/NADH:ubiquinone oxidoreductase subunit I